MLPGKFTHNCPFNINYCNFIYQRNLLELSTSIVLIVLFYSCNPAPDQLPRTSQYTPYCQCEVGYKADAESEVEMLQLQTPDEREEKNLHKIFNHLGFSIRPYKLCKVKEIPGSVIGFATHINDLLYIIYDGSTISPYINNWWSIYVLAHEVGHHVHGHLIDRTVHDHKCELEAEYFAGAILYKMGATLEEALGLVSDSFEATKTHPSGIKRNQSIRKGWMDAAGLNPIQPDPVVPATTAPPTKSKANLGGKWYPTIIIGDREIMTEDLKYPLGRAACYNNKTWGCLGFLYTIEEARRACPAVGWELITTDDFLAIIYLYAGKRKSDDNISTQDFDAIRAYGALLENGDSGFNANLGGIGFIDSDEIYYDYKGIHGNYWVSDLNELTQEPTYFNFSMTDGTLVRYRTGGDELVLSCRCARQVPQ